MSGFAQTSLEHTWSLLWYGIHQLTQRQKRYALDLMFVRLIPIWHFESIHYQGNHFILTDRSREDNWTGRNATCHFPVIRTIFEEVFSFLTLEPISSWRIVWCFSLHSLQDLSDEQSLIVCAPKQSKHRWCFLTCSRLNRISKPRVQIIAVFVLVKNFTKISQISVRTSMFW